MLAAKLVVALCALGQASRDGVDPWLDAFGAAMEALDAGELDRAHERLRAARELDPENAICAYHLACIAARRGDTERAVVELERAVSAGFDDVALARWDPDLASVRRLPALRAILVRAQDTRRDVSDPPVESVVVPEMPARNILELSRPSLANEGLSLVVPEPRGAIRGVDLRRARTTRRWDGASDGLKLVHESLEGRLLSVSSTLGGSESDVELCVFEGNGGSPILQWSIGRSWQMRAIELFRPDGKRAFTQPWRASAQLWDCETAELVARIDHEPREVSARAWSRDSRWLAIGTRKGEVQLYDADSLAPFTARWQVSSPDRFGRTRSVFALAFDACGERLAVGFWDPGTRSDPVTFRMIEEAVRQDDIAIMEVPSGRVVTWLDQRAFNLRSCVTGLEFTPDGRCLVSADTGDVCYFELRTGKQLWAWCSDEGGDGMSCAIECCSNSPYVATWGHACREGVFDTRNGVLVTSGEGRSSRTWCISEPLRLFARSDIDVLDLFGADAFELRAQNVRISAEEEFVHTPSGWWDGTVGGLRGAKVFTADGQPVDVEREARRRWDPKRVRASIAGVKVRPPRAR